MLERVLRSNHLIYSQKEKISPLNIKKVNEVAFYCKYLLELLVMTYDVVVHLSAILFLKLLKKQ